MAGCFLYYVITHIAGELLRQLLNRETQRFIDLALNSAQQAASALDFAQRHAVVRQEIKVGVYVPRTRD